MTQQAQDAYEKALSKIEACRRQGKAGTTLNLNGMGLTQVPPEIGQLTALTQLDLRNNQLSTLPPEIGQLTALTVLYLRNNQLSTLPPEIGQLTALTLLYLLNNQLSTLPPEIGQLKALTGLYLHGNSGLGLPEGVLGPTLDESHSNNPVAKPQAILDYYFALKTQGRTDAGGAAVDGGARARG